MNHNQLRLKRIRFGISQKVLAEKIGLSPSRLCLYERYGMDLPANTVYRIEKLLDDYKQHETVIKNDRAIKSRNLL